MSGDAPSNSSFKRLQSICVPLLKASLLTKSSIPDVLSRLTDLVSALHQFRSSGEILTPSLVSYIFFPISAILRRNISSEIPDQVLEKILDILSILCDSWWWDCEVTIWGQIFMLCGLVIGGIESKGSKRERSDEVKEAAARCLIALIRERSAEEATVYGHPAKFEQQRLAIFQEHAESPKFIPILGQTLDSLLSATESPHLALQLASLRLVHSIVCLYAADSLIPTIMPGIISCMTKVALGVSGRKSWANGDIVAGALDVMREVIIKALGDEACIRDGAVRAMDSLEDLLDFSQGFQQQEKNEDRQPYTTRRTHAWLLGTSSQLHIALNSLSPLVYHPTPSALVSLSSFASSVLAATTLTLPQSQSLLISFLLSLSSSEFPRVSADAHRSLVQLLTTKSRGQQSLLQILLHLTKDSLNALPHLILSHADPKVEYGAKLIEAACKLAAVTSPSSTYISASFGKLLGPSGGVEKWGWTLLSVLQFSNPPFIETRTFQDQLMIEGEQREWVPFPDVEFKNVSSLTTRDALAKMFRALGQATQDDCLFAVEWFGSVARNGRTSRSVVALWCACRLLEGIAGISLSSEVKPVATYHIPSRRLAKLARMLARSISELWDNLHLDSLGHDDEVGREVEELQPVHHVKGLIPVHSTLKIFHPTSVTHDYPTIQPILHQALCLQLISITAGILQADFTPLLVYTMYPILHSLVSPVFYLSATALATLDFITTSASYASPANLLLSNFDYALNGISRRFNHRWVDVDASKVLALLVRLVGNDVVGRAGDIIEECFDRLDEFHGYDVIVDGLIEVLGEVVKVVESDEAAKPLQPASPSEHRKQANTNRSMDSFFEWFAHREDSAFREDNTDYGHAPREAWGNSKGKGIEDEPSEDDSGNLKGTNDDDPPATPAQALTKQIVVRSLYFLTHSSPVIRARILNLLTSSVPVLPESALLPSVHQAWPFILNRLDDHESFVIAAAASLVESLATYVGSFMFRRVWDDVWPRFQVMLAKLNAADDNSALVRSGLSAVGTESAYTNSHRLYRSLLNTMTAAMNGVPPKDSSVWQVVVSFRRFLHSGAHEELQSLARNLYIAIGENNADAVWLALYSTMGIFGRSMNMLQEKRWDIKRNVNIILQYQSLA